MKNIWQPILFSVLKFISAIIFFLTILSAYGGRINPQHLATPSLLCLAMPYFAFLTVIAILFWALCRKFIFVGIGVATLIICIPTMSQAIPFSFPSKPGNPDNTFKIISWNVLHTLDIRDTLYNSNRAVEFMINSEADIIALTELNNFSPHELRKASEALIDSLNTAYPFHAGLNSTDIKILSKFPVDRLNISFLDYDGRHRFDFFQVSFPYNQPLIVGMVHLYSFGLSDEERNVVTEINSVSTAKESVKEFKGPILKKLKDGFRHRAQNAVVLREVLDSIPKNIPLIVCGDFNDVPASWTYNIVRGEDMHDAYAETNFGPAITYNLHKFYFHIDQMLYRGPLKALDLKIGKINTSDHYPLIGEFEFTDRQELNEL